MVVTNLSFGSITIYGETYREDVLVVRGSMSTTRIPTLFLT